MVQDSVPAACIWWSSDFHVQNRNFDTYGPQIYLKMYAANQRLGRKRNAILSEKSLI